MTTTTGTPLYERIAADLREQILSGALPEGSKLPGQNPLAAHYQVDPHTVRRGQDILIGEGLLHAHGRGGLFVARRAQTIAAGREYVLGLLMRRRAEIIQGRRNGGDDVELELVTELIDAHQCDESS